VSFSKPIETRRIRGARRIRGDLIETYKIVTGKVGLSADRFLKFSNEIRTKGHKYKFVKKPVEGIKQKYFSARVVNYWNGLDDETVSVDIYSVSHH
jgi:hypothetical protein